MQKDKQEGFNWLPVTCPMCGHLSEVHGDRSLSCYHVHDGPCDCPLSKQGVFNVHVLKELERLSNPTLDK